jgi:hypothetical protein
VARGKVDNKAKIWYYKEKPEFVAGRRQVQVFL